LDFGESVSVEVGNFLVINNIDWNFRGRAHNAVMGKSQAHSNKKMIKILEKGRFQGLTRVVSGNQK
jgi:hypothetical protein